MFNPTLPTLQNPNQSTSNLDTYYDISIDDQDVITCNNIKISFDTQHTLIPISKFNLSNCYNFKMNILGWVAFNCGGNIIAFWAKGDSGNNNELTSAIVKNLDQYLPEEDQQQIDYMDFDWLGPHLLLILKHKNGLKLFYFLFWIDIDQNSVE